MKCGPKPPARFSYPPLVWRNCGWPESQAGDILFMALTNPVGDGYVVERAMMLRREAWVTVEERDDPDYFVVQDSNGDLFAVDAARCFESESDATVEAINLTLWLDQTKRRERYEEMSGKTWPHEKVSEAGAVLPDGMLTVKVVKGEESETKSTGKYSIVFRTRVVEPQSLRNQPYRLNFVIGTEDDPEADESDTWMASFAASRYKSFLKAADVPETGDIEEELDAAVGATLRIENGHSDDGKYNDPRAFYRAGEGEEERSPAKAAKTEAKAGSASKKPIHKPEPEPESDEGEGEGDAEGEWE